MKIHILGASGSGVTTLGTVLSKKINFVYFDTDSFYWKPSDPAFTIRRNFQERNDLLANEVATCTDCIVGGSLLSWGDKWLSAFDLVVFLWVPPDVRIERLKKREFTRYGDVIFADKERNTHYAAFIDWAAHYDDGTARGRTLQAHENWMQQITCPLIELRGIHSVKERLAVIANHVALSGI